MYYCHVYTWSVTFISTCRLMINPSIVSSIFPIPDASAFSSLQFGYSASASDFASFSAFPTAIPLSCFATVLLALIPLYNHSFELHSIFLFLYWIDRKYLILLSSFRSFLSCPSWTIIFVAALMRSSAVILSSSVMGWSYKELKG